MSEIRILHIVPNMQAGGLETFIMNVYRNIDKSKVQFDFLVHYKKRCFYDDEIEKLGGKIHRFSLREDNKVLKYIKQLDDFFKTHKEYKIVHCHMSSISFLVFWVAKKNGVKIRIAHSHNSNTENTFKGFVKKILIQPCKYLSTDNYACSKSAGKFLFGSKSFTVIPNGIDIEKFKYNEKIRNEMREKLNIKDKFVLGHVGRFCEQKNHDFLINVFYEVQKYEPNSILLLIGTGELEDKIKKKVQDLKIKEKVLFLENRQDVNKLYSAMDCFTFPSKFEGLGIVLVEAQVSGLNIITSTKVPDEVMISKGIQRLKLDVNMWKEEILKLKNLKRTYQKINEKILEYDIKAVASKLQEEYEKYYQKEIK